MKQNSLGFLFVLMIFASCSKDNASGPEGMDYKNEMQNIIYGNDQSYSKKILVAHFDGVYLDIIDAFENWE